MFFFSSCYNGKPEKNEINKEILRIVKKLLKLRQQEKKEKKETIKNNIIIDMEPYQYPIENEHNNIESDDEEEPFISVSNLFREEDIRLTKKEKTGEKKYI